MWACLLAGGWGLVFAFGLCSRGCLRACLCALAWGWWDSVVPPPLITLTALWRRGLLVLTRRVWARSLVCEATLGAGCNSMGRDNHVPPHAAWRWVAFGRPVARREGRGVWGALMVC